MSTLPAITRSPRRAVAAGLALAVIAVASGPTVVLAERSDRTVARVPAPGITAIGPTTTFFGRGYGHGVGMSQHGARGRALAGQSTETILAHYYRGTSNGKISTTTPIRVRVLAGFKASSTRPLQLRALVSTWTIDGLSKTFPKDARITVTPKTAGGATTWRLVVKSSSGSVLHDAATKSFRVRPSSGSGLVRVDSRSSSYDEYRGIVRARLSSTTATLNVINELPLETYLRGVVPAEMPSSWPVVALRAQAIAARSYAARRLRPGVSYYDVNDDSTSQVYLGKEGEKAATDQAISATSGGVLRSGSSIANTLFHSAGGAATEDNENVFTSSSGKIVAGPVSYLRGSADRDPDGVPYDLTSPYATWKTSSLTRSQLSSVFGSDPRTDVGSLTGLDLRDRGVSGRLIRVTLIGTDGSKTVSGNLFRSIFNDHRPSGTASMRSTLVDTVPVP
jgi:SpoIID/LytB domain protein